jgi:hypothetical protein
MNSAKKTRKTVFGSAVVVNQLELETEPTASIFSVPKPEPYLFYSDLLETLKSHASLKSSVVPLHLFEFLLSLFPLGCIMTTGKDLTL